MSKFSVKQVLNSVPKRTAAILGIAAAVLVPLGIYAWGPTRDTYTMEKPADHVTFNSITDNPDVGDERNFFRVREVGQKDWTDTINLQAGKTYEARMYVHNNAAANLNLTSTNTRATMYLPNASNVYGKQFEVNSIISSDNADPTKVWDNIVLKSDKEFHVKIVSQKYYNNIRTEKSNGFDLSNDLYTEKGALLGYEQMDGNIKGCLAYSGYVLVRFTPEFKPETPKNPGYDVIKTVDKTSAKPGDTINYTITVKNTGDQDLTNVKITDNIPQYYQEAKEDVTAPGKISGSLVKGGVMTIESLPVGKSATIKISYKIKSAENLPCGETKITNKATGTTDQDQTEDNNNNNEVTTTINKECTYSYDVIKTVDKTSAKPGDMLTYHIIVKNTGNQDLTNVKVTDKLPAYYTEAKEGANGDVTGSIVKDGAVTIKTLPAGSSVDITITYKLKAADDFQCGETKITNKATGTTDQDKTEDSNDNSEVTTVVTKECNPGYDVIKTVDKTSAKPGDTLTYTITAKNTGNVDLTNVKITDKLPSYYSDASEKVTAPSATNGSIVKKGELTIAKLPVGKSATVVITYKLKASDDFQCGTTKITNKVTGTTDQDKTEDKTDNNEVITTVERDCPSSYDLIKTVDKTSAKPGDTLTYTLTFKNTGDKALTNVIIKDVLPANVTPVGTVKAEPDADVSGSLLSSGIKIAKVEAGKTVTLTFQVVLNDADSFQCGDTTVTNVASSTTNEVKDEVDTTNNSASTTVSKECTPVVPPVETTTPPTTTPSEPTTYTPTELVATGAEDVLGSVIAVGAIAAAVIAYVKSRQVAKNNQ